MSGSVTVPGPGGGSVTIPASTAQNLAFLQIALSGIVGTTQNDTLGGAVTVPATGTGLLALAGSSASTVTGGDVNLRILSGFGGLTYEGGASSIIATGGNNNITATGHGAAFSQFVDVAGQSTVTSDFSLVMTEGGASSINAGTTNFVVYSGQDTVTTGSGPNTVAAIGSVGGVTHAGDGDLLFVVGGDSQGVQTIIGGAGQETVFAGPKSIFWDGANSTGALLFIGGPSASTIVGGSGQETLFGGTGGDVFQMGSAAGNIVVGGAASYTVAAGTGGNTAFFGNAGSNLTFTGTAGQTGNTLVVGNGAETINAGASSGNAFLMFGNGDSTVTASNGGGDLFRFFNQGTAGVAHNVTITDFIPGVGLGQIMQFIGYGFNPDNLSNADTITGPTQQIQGGNDVITLSDHTTITLIGVTTPLTFTNFNALS